MKKLLAGTIAFAFTVAVGCESKSPPGGPGARSDNKAGTTAQERGTGAAPGTTTTARGQSEDSANTFKLVQPSTVDLKQNEAKNATVKIDRGKSFDQPVTLTFELPKDMKGVTIEPKSVEIQPGHDSASVKVQTTNDTPVGDFSVNVVATPKTGQAVHQTMKIKVDKGGTAR